MGKSNLNKLLIQFAKQFLFIGIDFRYLYNLTKVPRYLRDRCIWTKSGGKIDHTVMMLNDYSDAAGTTKGHYFHQDLLVAGLIHEQNPVRHVDVGSRIDGFVAHVASYREIEVLDIRPLPSTAHRNIKFSVADLMVDSAIGTTDSLSCLHAIEHFGLGRYGDPIDIYGHRKGISNLIRLLDKGGTLYLSVPIGAADAVYFNAHRVFHPESILRFPEVQGQLYLSRFDYVDDDGELHLEKDPSNAVGHVDYGCGIYTFKKIA